MTSQILKKYYKLSNNSIFVTNTNLTRTPNQITTERKSTKTRRLKPIRYLGDIDIILAVWIATAGDYFEAWGRFHHFFSLSLTQATKTLLTLSLSYSLSLSFSLFLCLTETTKTKPPRKVECYKNVVKFKRTRTSNTFLKSS